MAKKTYYIGLGVTYHDPALAIVDDSGKPLFAEASERYLQYKRAINCDADPPFRLPALLREHCPDAERFVVAFNWRRQRPWYEQAVAALGVLRAEGLQRLGIKRLRSPLNNRLIHHAMACNRLNLAGGGLNLARLLGEEFPHCTLEFRDFDHHTAHAASACHASPFADAVCAVVDSYGENGSLGFFRYRHGKLERLHEARGLGSLGLFYMHLTALCGFDWMQGEEWKVMGLAPYGRLDEEVYAGLHQLLRVRGLNLEHPKGSTFAALAALAIQRRRPSEPAEYAADLAYTGQRFFADIMTALLANFRKAHPHKHLCLAGGCALNSSYNGQILAKTGFHKLYIPPAPADDGTALGAAWLAWAAEHETVVAVGEPLSPYLGSTLGQDTLARLVCHAAGLHIRHCPQTIAEETARLLEQGKLVAWAQGRAEFGPRALGNRSILADPRNPGMKAKINERVKFREEYRPFAPAILHEYGAEYFERYQEAPYMEQAQRFRPAMMARVPAVVHVDGTGRLQTVKAAWNPKFHQLLTAFHRLTDVPVLLNTSFNVMGKPIAHSVEDAIAVLMTSGLDALILDDWLIAKPEAP